MADIADVGFRVDPSGIDKARASLSQMAAETKNVETGSGKMSQKMQRDVEQINGSLQKATSFLKRFAAVLISAQTLRMVAGGLKDLADGWSDLNSRVKVSISAQQDASVVMEHLARIARSTYTSMEFTAESFARNAVTLRALGKTTQEQLDYTSALNNALVVSGAKGQVFEQVQNALGKAMATGSLRGLELNTVLDRGSAVAEALAAELRTTTVGLRQMGADGKITGDIIFNALTKRMEEMESRAESMPATVADGFQLISNSVLGAVGAFDSASGASGAFAGWLVKVADAIQMAFSNIGALVVALDDADDAQQDVSMSAESMARAIKVAVTAFVIAKNAADIFFSVIATGARNLGTFVAAVIDGFSEMGAAMKRLIRALTPGSGYSIADAFRDNAAGAARVMSAFGSGVKSNMAGLAESVQKDMRDIARAWQWMGEPAKEVTKLNKEQRAAYETATAASSGLGKATKALAGETAKLTEAQKRANKAIDEAFALDEKRISATEGQIRAAREMLEEIQFETEALSMTNTEREVAIKLRELERQGIVAGTLAYDNFAEKIRDAVIGRAAVEESIRAQQEVQEEWGKTWDQVSQSFTDQLMEGGRSVKEYLINLFRTMVLRPILQPIVGGVLGAVGLGAAGSAAAGTTNLLSAVSGANSLYGAVSGGMAAGVGTGIGALGGDAIMGMLGAKSGVIGAAQMGSTSALAGGAIASVGAALAGQALNSFISSGYRISKGADTLETGATVIAAAINPLAGVVVGAVSGVVNALFGRKLKDSGIEGTFSSEGFAGQQYEYYKGGLFRSNKTKRRDLDPDLQEALSGQFAALQYATAGMADTLGASSDAIFAYTDTVKVSLKGLSEEEAQAKLTAEFDRMGEAMAALVPGMSAFARSGETSAETLARLSTALVSVNQAFDTLGLALAEGLAGGDFASQFVEAMGGGDAMGQALGQYFQDYYTEAERVATATRQMGEALGAMGLVLPDTRDGFRALVESAREAGDPQMLAALLKLAPAFATIATSTDDLAQQAQQSAQQLEQAAIQAAQAVASQRAGLERQLLEAMDDKAGLRALDLSALDASNRALQERIWAIQDARAAEADAAQRVAAQMQAAAAQMQAVAQQRYQIETRLLTLQGDTAELRARELAQLDPSNRALQEQVWLLEDQQRQAQAAAQAATAAAARTAQIRSEWGRLASSVYDEIRRIRGDLYGSAASYSQAQSSFAIAAVQARAGDASAMQALPGLSRQLLDLAEQNASTASELNLMRAYTVGALEQAGRTASAKGGTAAAGAGGVQTTSDPELLAEIQAMRTAFERIVASSEKTAQVLDDAQRGRAPLATESQP